jgi:hypothetical protein
MSIDSAGILTVRSLYGEVIPREAFFASGVQECKRFFEIPDFRQYAVADGISRLPSGWKIGPRPEPLK